MPDEKIERDTRKQFSQVDMDAATKPLHAEIERLKARQSKWVPERVPVPAFDNEPAPPNRLLAWLKSWLPRRAEPWNGVGSYPQLPRPIPPHPTPPPPPQPAVNRTAQVVTSLSDEEIQRVAERVVDAIRKNLGGLAAQIRGVGRG